MDSWECIVTELGIKPGAGDVLEGKKKKFVIEELITHQMLTMGQMRRVLKADIWIYQVETIGDLMKRNFFEVVERKPTSDELERDWEERYWI